MLGRPTVITPEILDKLREAFLMGFSDKEACFYADIGQSTLYDYQKDNPEFSEQKEQYKVNPILKAKKTIFDALEKGDVKVSQWYLERKAKGEFSTRVEATISELDIEHELDKLETDYDKVAREVQGILE